MPIVHATDESAPFHPAYFDTVFLVRRPPPGWPRAFAIVTAHNPGGRPSDARENDLAARALDDFLRAERIESFEVVGASPDLRHREIGHGFATGLARAAEISARFGQEAFFWVEDGVVYICTGASGKGWRVAKWEERMLAGNGYGFVPENP